MSVSDMLFSLYYNCKYTTFSKEQANAAFNYITCNMTMLIRFVKYQEIDSEYIERILGSDICNSGKNKRIILNKLANFQRLSKDFIHKYLGYFSAENYKYLIRSQELSIDSIIIILSSDNSDSIIKYQNLPERFILDNTDILSKDLICSYQPLSEQFIEEVGTESSGGWINLSLAGQNRLYSTPFIIKYLNVEAELDGWIGVDSSNFLSIENIVKYQNMDKETVLYVLRALRDYSGTIVSNLKVKKLVESMSWRQSISSEYIKKYINLWTDNSSAVEELLIYQVLSEDLILYMAGSGLITETGWRFLSRNQKLSASVFHRFRNQIHKCENSVEELRKYSGARVVGKRRAGLDNNVVNKIFEFM